ncbi:hypothetical protein DOTSEDRAFT_152334 [Dothistroma septosporum NZE10]|uniref:Uncharacterized protein n=1 Tax=Dothistroma septosporum (strain NZE10 / CBS 128990) TaxID=675120 RepID=N1PPV5_DOTSN|nr:hypothetical protein DOTSEDRAFT_152334 [Dothistroma septosporum NZE10]
MYGMDRQLFVPDLATNPSCWVATFMPGFYFTCAVKVKRQPPRVSKARLTQRGGLSQIFLGSICCEAGLLYSSDAGWMTSRQIRMSWPTCRGNNYGGGCRCISRIRIRSGHERGLRMDAFARTDILSWNTGWHDRGLDGSCVQHSVVREGQ